MAFIEIRRAFVAARLPTQPPRGTCRVVMKAIAPHLVGTLAPWLLLSAFFLFPMMTAVGLAHA